MQSWSKYRNTFEFAETLANSIKYSAKIDVCSTYNLIYDGVEYSSNERIEFDNNMKQSFNEIKIQEDSKNNIDTNTYENLIFNKKKIAILKEKLQECILLEAYEKEEAERLLLLGDILYHGPRNDLPEGYAPKEVIELLNARKNDIYCVRGNCDTEVDQMVLEFPVLADYCVIAEGETAVYATHGHIYNEQKLPPLHPGDILLHGHTHVPKCAVHEEESYIYMNPGSVSLPKEDSWHGYMIWEGSEFVWKDFDGQEHMRKKLS